WGGSMGIELREYQTTLKSSVTLSGIGVHSGKPVSISFHPADADTGITFTRTDLGEGTRELRALASEVGATDLCTVLGQPGGVYVATVEHLMASFSALGIDNAGVEIDAEE